MSGAAGGNGGGGGGGGPPGINNLTGILNWSLAHSDGTAPPKQISEEDKKWFFEAMAASTINPVERMKSISAELTAGAAGTLSEEQLERSVALLEELQDHVEDIDCACDLSKVGGLQALLALLRSPHAQLRAAAAEVLGTAAQNNPKAQQRLLDGGVMEPLLPLAREDADDTVRLKGLLALGCLIRNFPPGEAAFKLGDGFGLLKSAACSGELRVQRKAFQLARALLTTDVNLATLVDLGFIRAAAAALLSQDGLLREAALALLLAIARCADFDALPRALDELRHPALEERLAGLRASIAALPPAAAERAADEAELADALHAMLAPAS